MKKLKIGVFVIFLITITATTLYSCSNDEAALNEKGTGLIDPIQVGVLHNEYLAQAMKTENKNNSLSKTSVFMGLDIQNLTDEQKAEIIQVTSSVTPEQMKEITFSKLTNPLAKDYYNMVDEALDESNSIQDLNNRITDITTLINSNLNGQDWDIVMIYAETIKSSAEFWFPENLGGKGLGFSMRISKMAKKGANVSKTRVSDWVKADGRGAAYASVTWAVGAALAGGPVAPVTYSAAVTGGALWKSFAP